MSRTKNELSNARLPTVAADYPVRLSTKLVVLCAAAFFIVSAWQLRVTLPVRLSFITGLVATGACSIFARRRFPLRTNFVLWGVLAGAYLAIASVFGEEIVVAFVAADFLSFVGPLFIVGCLAAAGKSNADATYLVTRLALFGFAAMLAAKFFFPIGNRFWVAGPITLAFVADNLFRSRGRDRVFAIAMLVGTAALVLDSGSRLAALQLVLALLIALLALRGENSQSRTAIVMAAGLVVVLAIGSPQSRSYLLDAVDESRAIELTSGTRTDNSGQRRLEEMDQVLEYTANEWNIAQFAFGEGHGATYISADSFGPTRSTRTASGRVHAVHLGLPRTYLRYGLTGIGVLALVGIFALRRARLLLRSNRGERRVIGAAVLLYIPEYLVGNPTVDLGFTVTIGAAIAFAGSVDRQRTS